MHGLSASFSTGQGHRAATELKSCREITAAIAAARRAIDPEGCRMRGPESALGHALLLEPIIFRYDWNGAMVKAKAGPRPGPAFLWPARARVLTSRSSLAASASRASSARTVLKRKSPRRVWVGRVARHTSGSGLSSYVVAATPDLCNRRTSRLRHGFTAEVNILVEPRIFTR